MNEQELSALIEILNRTPMSISEKLWVQDMINKLLTVARLPDKGKDERNA